MKKVLSVLVLLAVAVTGCKTIPIREGATGTPSGMVFTGDCIEDHFDHYFDCMAQQYGGPEGGANGE